MIELPEAMNIAIDLKKTILNKRIKNVVVKQSPHNFAFIEGDFNKLIGKEVTNIIERNFYVEFVCEDLSVIMRDGAILRYYEDSALLPQKHQLLIEFKDNTYLVVTVAMYACIATFKTNKPENIYYLKELNGISPLDKNFTLKNYQALFNDDINKLSAKAFLATEQRFLGIGNGVCQDILFNAKIHPKKKIRDIDKDCLDNLFYCMKDTLLEMINLGGRDTEKDIFGNSGNYITKMGKNSLKKPCSNCQSEIKKENYLGGSIYYCPSCQKL